MKGKDSILEKINKLRSIYYIAVEMNKAHSTKELLDIILDKCVALTRATSGSVMLINKKDKVLDIVSYKGIKKEIANKTKLKIGEGVTGWVAKTGSPKLVNNIKLDPLYVQVREDILSELAVPIKTDTELIGVISVDSDKEDAFSNDDMDLLMMVAELAAQIFMHDAMREELEHKLKSQEILISAFNILEREKDLKKIFQEIMEVLKEKMDILRGMLVLFDKEESESLTIQAGYKISEEAMKRGIYKIGEGIIGKAVLQGETILVEDISKEPDFLNKMKIRRHGEGPISFIASPIKLESNVIGVLAIEKKFDCEKYLNDSVHTLTILTSLIAYKVKNYQEEQEKTKSLLKENLQLKKVLENEYSTKSIIGQDEKIRKIIETLPLVANSFAPILITGETGTGKELIAKAIHFLSDRKDEKFVSVNCSAIPENLLEAELFGYKKGAFTGANTNKKGKFEIADKGTLFLDEIGDMPLSLQAKILRAIQEKEIEPLGSETAKKVDLHVIAATNKNLQEMVEKGKFRSDLFFRLNVITIHLPALRERVDDILLLADFFLKKFNKLYKKNIKFIDNSVRDIFLKYDWPGNIRELEHVIERAVILAQSDVIDFSLLPESLQRFQEKVLNLEKESVINKWIIEKVMKNDKKNVYDMIVDEIEKILIEEVLILCDYNKSKAANMLGINRNTLKTKIKKYNIL